MCFKCYYVPGNWDDKDKGWGEPHFNLYFAKA